MTMLSQARWVTTSSERIEPLMALLRARIEGLDSDLSVYKVTVVIDEHSDSMEWWCEVSHQTRTAKGTVSGRAALSRIRLDESEIEVVTGGMVRLP